MAPKNSNLTRHDRLHLTWLSLLVFDSAELLFELTGDFELVSEPIVFVSMSPYSSWYQT